MGCASYSDTCKTCNCKLKQCPGHFGHVHLAVPVLHVGFVPLIIKVLRCICFHCSSLMCRNSPELAKIRATQHGKQRLDSVLKLCERLKNKSCPDRNTSEDAGDIKYGLNYGDGCGNEQPAYRIEAGKVMYIEREFLKPPAGNVHQKSRMDTAHILDIFKRMTIDTVEALGFQADYAHPKSFVITMLPVLPPCVRPSVELAGSTGRSSDDLTLKYIEIVKSNQKLKRAIERGAPSTAHSDEWELLQYHVATLFDNQKPGLNLAMQKSGKPLKSIRERLQGKAGRVRGNLMGKRVDFSARTVISGDPNLPIDDSTSIKIDALTHQITANTTSLALQSFAN